MSSTPLLALVTLLEKQTHKLEILPPPPPRDHHHHGRLIPHSALHPPNHTRGTPTTLGATAFTLLSRSSSSDDYALRPTPSPSPHHTPAAPPERERGYEHRAPHSGALVAVRARKPLPVRAAERDTGNVDSR
ncbi:hypothetical protein DFH09DRAFT_1318045 [Mycena vulgaris]|nr:hypothetical protein DFH09DRAFT_1318045 [Mycena vulgaris]